MSDFVRPKEGFRFRFRGMKLGVPADAIPPGKYAIAVNVRAFDEETTQTRPGLVQKFTTGGPAGIITDFRAYSNIGTDDLPRILTRNSDDSVWLDTAAQVGTLAGGGASPIATLVPFRPNRSANPYMYIANGNDFQKFSAPPVVQQKVGIIEPTSVGAGTIEPSGAPEALELPLLASAVSLPVGSWTLGGTAGTIGTANRVLDLVGAAAFQDPNGGASFSLQVSVALQYQRLMPVTIAGAGNIYQVQDVFQPSATNINILGITYFSGSTGRCVIVPSNLAPGPTSKGGSLYDPSVLTSLRRGSLLQFNGGVTESVYVLSVVTGPDGSVAIEVSTTVNHTSAETLNILPGIAVSQIVGSHTPVPGDSIKEVEISYIVGTGIGTATTTAPVSNLFVSGGAAFQPDDYISFGMVLDVPANLLECKVLFDINDGTFTKDFLYYTIRPSDLAAAVSNTVTQVSAVQTITQREIIDEEAAAMSNNQGVAFSSAQFAPGSFQWAQFFVPLKELTRVGNTQGVSLQNLQKIQFLWNASGSLSIAHDSTVYVSGGSQPDTGEVGAPYRYRVRGRSSVTGATGNPSPATRYGLTLRRQSANVLLPNNIIDSVDTWDVFRYGGSVTSWRYIGSAPAAFGTAFKDNFSDDEAPGGDELEFDNFEPWPSVDLPFQNTNAKVNGTLITFSTASPGNLLRFLPGNLVQVGSGNVYTLRCRPTNVSGNNYLFQLEETANFVTGATVSIYEPEIARQFLPYMWGPDANGVVFACGDPLRAGSLYFCKPYILDAAPSSYNQEINPPSEPLVGGEVMDGVPFVASPEKWWRLYFQPDNPAQRYNPVQEPVPRGLAAPQGHCTDGREIYFWAKDGIYGIQKGSLTDEDLYRLFPHEGVKGEDQIYNGVTVKAPDYSRAKTFRLVHSNGFLYAIYQDSGGIYRNLTLDLKRMAWSSDDYTLSGQVTAAYHVEQQSSSSGVLNPVTLFAKELTNVTTQSGIYVQTPLHNDDTTPITVTLATNEYVAGDLRAPVQWGDLFVDLVPAASPSGVFVSGMSIGVPVTGTITVPTGTSRVRTPGTAGGIVVSDFMGLFFIWGDDFTRQSVATRLISWQPSFDIQPARIIALSTFGSSYGLQGYGHIRQIAIAWVSTQPIALTLLTVDGESPAIITIPSSGGAYNKQLFPVGANKGQLFSYRLSSSAIFQIFEDDCEVHMGAWARSGPYQIFKGLGGIAVAESPI